MSENDLREKIATLLGWTELNWKSPAHLGTPALYGKDPNRPDATYESMVPEYERSMAHAMAVIPKFKFRSLIEVEPGKIVCNFNDTDSAVGKNEAEALCLAALKATS